jgi:signal peptidase I
VEGNFALLLFLATVVTGIYWLAERFVFPAQASTGSCLAGGQATQRREELTKLGISQGRWRYCRSPPTHS